jgi:glutamine phosphoribosylpyrophosphate amidotransferase
MCGIGGIYNCTGAKTPITPTMTLWSDLSARGRHAAGMAVATKKGVSVIKAPQSSQALSISKRDLIPKTGVRSILLHTRYATKGDIEANGNNHPINEHDIVMTHNGVLYNDDEVFDTLNVHRFNQVDSEAINAALRYGGTSFVADEIKGSMSIAWIDVHKIDTVNLFTNGGNPLVIARTEGGNIVWASGLDYIEDAGFKVESHFHAVPFKVYTLSPSGTIESEYVSDQRRVADTGNVLGEWARRGIVSSPKKRRGSINPRKSRKARAIRTQIGKKGQSSEVDPVWLAPWVRDGGKTSPHDWAWKPLQGWVRRDEV